MKTKLSLSLVALFATGLCFAQAPVVDAQDDRSTSRTVPPIDEDSLQPATSSGAIVGDFEINSRLETLERVVNSRTETQQLMQSRLDELQNDIDQIRGSIELHNYQLEKLLERQRELFLELDRRFVAMQQSTNELGSSVGLDPSAVNSLNTINNATQNASSGVSENEAYQNAVNLILKQKDYAAAVPAFQSFLAQYSNSELTPNAHYWLGQLLYNQQDYNGAKEQFAQVVSKFPSSPKRPDSLVKLANIEKSAGNVSAANELFQQVIDEYPNTASANIAARQLAN